MRAVLIRSFGDPAAARVEQVAHPAPGPRQVVVQVHAAPVNYVDTIVIAGAYQFKPTLPFTPGKGPAGIVTAIGPEVRTLRPGDRVLAMAEYGGYAEAVAVAAEQCYVLPPRMSFVEASSLSLAFDTAWFALFERGRLKPGETVLVLGATGAVGYAAMQLAKAKGARVLAGVSSPHRADAARAGGADAVIDLSAPDLRESLRAQVFAANAGIGADVIVDPLGGDVFDAAVRAAAWRGRVVVIGFAAGRIPSLRINYLLVKNIEVSGLQISDYRVRRPEMLAECFAEVFACYEAGRIVPQAAQTFPLDHFAEALAVVRSRKTSGRVVLLPRGTADG